MKFLIALTVLASSSVFANDFEHKIKCWETAQEEGGRPDLVFIVKDGGMMEDGRKLFLKYPFWAFIKSEEGCLKGYAKPEMGMRHDFEACRTQGQDINGLIPVDVSYDYEEHEDEGTYYCERELKRYFWDRD